MTDEEMRQEAHKSLVTLRYAIVTTLLFVMLALASFAGNQIVQSLPAGK